MAERRAVPASDNGHLCLNFGIAGIIPLPPEDSLKWTYLVINRVKYLFLLKLCSPYSGGIVFKRHAVTVSVNVTCKFTLRLIGGRSKSVRSSLRGNE